MCQAEEYVQRVLKVLIHIEAHIDEELTVEGLAKMACYSPFHFHRIFHGIVGETVHQYVKRLRMQRAASTLRYTEQLVTDIALDTSYDTPSAFTKAFKQWMGASPKGYRALHVAANRMTKNMKGVPMIQPDKIEKNLPDLHLLFVRRCGDYIQSAREAWQAMIGFVHANYLDCSNMRYFGIAHDDPQVTSKDRLRYDAAILAPLKATEQRGVGRQTLKGGKYAIFTHHGSYEGLEDAFERVFLKWLPDSLESLDGGRAVFCEYCNMEYANTEPEKLITKMYIPLR